MFFPMKILISRKDIKRHQIWCSNVKEMGQHAFAIAEVIDHNMVRGVGGRSVNTRTKKLSKVLKSCKIIDYL